MKLPVIFYPGEDGYVLAKCPVLPGCVSQGTTKKEALESIKEAIEGCIEVRREMGLPDTEEMMDVEVAL